MKHYKQLLLRFCLVLMSQHFVNYVMADNHQVIVLDPFLEMHTGPGRGYPVFHIAEEGEWVTIDKRRTDWFKVETTDRRPQQGWVHISQMSRTMDNTGAHVVFPNSTQADAIDRRWEWSMSGGIFGGINSIASSVSLHLTQNITTQLQFSQIFGNFSDSQMIVASIQHSPFPHWRFSPYVQLGTGILKTKSFSTIVQSEDSTNQTVNVGAGANIYLSRRFITYLDYRYHTVLTSRDKHEEIHEWKIGISIFF